MIARACGAAGADLTSSPGARLGSCRSIGLLELLQGRARLDAELLHEQAARLPVDLERVRLPTRAVQRPHQLARAGARAEDDDA